ncbi:hypothetical protein JB92DRAFT_3118346 [Gautieria morchelliformis]|nr:hypothetical protein JB92DRAFT_3118346 [Gautieria morchelliformis]
MEAAAIAIPIVITWAISRTTIKYNSDIPLRDEHTLAPAGSELTLRNLLHPDGQIPQENPVETGDLVDKTSQRHIAAASDLSETSAPYDTDARIERGHQEGLEATISSFRETLVLEPAPHSDPAISLATLGTRFNESGEQEDLEEAISLHREALELQPAPHPDRSSSFSNLATALLFWNPSRLWCYC